MDLRLNDLQVRLITFQLLFHVAMLCYVVIIRLYLPNLLPRVPSMNYNKAHTIEVKQSETSEEQHKQQQHKTRHHVDRKHDPS